MKKEEFKNKIIDYQDGIIEQRLSNTSPPPVSIISKNEYVVRETGEVRERKIPKRKYDALKTVQQQMLKAREKIHFNSSKSLPYVWAVTVTCEDNIVNYSEGEVLQKQFLRRLKNYYPGIRYGLWRELQYERKAWHYHYILWRESDQLMIKKDAINNLWKNGKVHVKQLKKQEDLIDYLFYLCNYSVDYKKRKRMKKIKTLRYINANLKLFSCSQNLERPPVEYSPDRLDEGTILLSSKRKYESDGKLIPRAVMNKK